MHLYVDVLVKMKYALQGRPEDKTGNKNSRESVIDVVLYRIERRLNGRDTDRTR